MTAGLFELRKGGQVKVVIEENVTNEKTLELSPAVRCRECRSCLLESNIIDSAMALNWTAIDDINIKRVVSVTTFNSYRTAVTTRVTTFTHARGRLSHML